MQSFGAQIRRTRQRLAFTLDDLAKLTGISKPYLSLIETDNVPNPPSDEKLVKLEQMLKLPAGQLVRQAHLLRTPKDVRDALTELARERGRLAPAASPHEIEKTNPIDCAKAVDKPWAIVSKKPSKPPAKPKFGKSLDVAYLSGVLHEMADRVAGGPEPIRLKTVPVVNRVSAGYPKDFTDLAYPRGVADAFIGCPDIDDPDAFAARVAGDSMAPKYQPGDVVIFSPALPIRSGDDCFARFEDGQTTFKQAFFEQDAEGNEVIRLNARNPNYAPRVVPRDQISGLYRAKFKYQSLDGE